MRAIRLLPNMSDMIAFSDTHAVLSICGWNIGYSQRSPLGSTRAFAWSANLGVKRMCFRLWQWLAPTNSSVWDYLRYQMPLFFPLTTAYHHFQLEKSMQTTSGTRIHQ